jgi:hypothetical protein
MYTNVSNSGLLKIINIQLKHNNVGMCTSKEMLEFCKIILDQNYIQPDVQLYIQADGLAMGSSASFFFQKYHYSI